MAEDDAAAIAGNGNLLDLSGPVDRPKVRLPEGDFGIRLPEELTMSEYARVLRIMGHIEQIGDEFRESSSDVEKATSEGGLLDQMQEAIVEGARLMIVDVTDEAARNLTPGQFGRLTGFFNALTRRGAEGVPSSPSSSSAPGASASTEHQAAD